LVFVERDDVVALLLHDFDTTGVALNIQETQLLATWYGARR